MTDYLKEFETNLAYHFSEITGHLFARPHWIYISLSHKCTYSCQMCAVVKILKGYELPIQTAKRALDEISSWEWDCVLTFTGGEPFLREDIFEIFNYSTGKGLKIEAVSNGSLIDKALAGRIISSGLQNIAISLDGAQEKTHDSVRQKGGFKKAINAVENLVMAKRELGSGPQISVWTTIMKENVRELFDIIALTKNLGVECLVYHPVIVTQDDMQNTSSSAPFWIRKNDLEILREQIDKIMEYQSSNGLVAFLHNPYLWLKYFDTSLSRESWKCNPFVFVNIGPDGEVRSCGSAFGNIGRMKLEECLTAQQAVQARRLMKVCEKPCLQTCWAHPESDSLPEILSRFIGGIKDRKDKNRLLKKALKILDDYKSRIVNLKNA
ncbi:MAG: radical SAM protein [Candidatus Omnitrophica bacterium]|nr:radical SAM protein [Candidatus Omnitrophota bacterium]MBU3934031.1 radical SAM protein [Candidatus Omnitrophota bacterium]